MALMSVARAGLPAALGLGKHDGGLEKLTIFYEKGGVGKFKGEIEALFNPETITIETAVEWTPRELAASEGGFCVLEPPSGGGYSPPTLALELFFDTCEGAPSTGGGAGVGQALKQAVTGGALGMHPGADPTGISVLEYTKEVVGLTRVGRDMHRPPICALKWGQLQIFEGVLTSLRQEFTLFLPNGTPVRAMLTCQFKQYQRAQETMMELDLHSANVPKTYMVRRRDTLTRIAAEMYNDPAMWRHIAKANGITNPRALSPGQVLMIPKLI